jgi:hypothetical protein
MWVTDRWFYKVIKMSGNGYPASMLITKILKGTDNITDIEKFQRLEEYFNKSHTDILKVSKFFYKQLLLHDANIIYFSDDFYINYSSSINTLESYGFISASHKEHFDLPLTIILIDPTYIIYLCALFDDDNNMFGLVDLVERCHVGLCLRGNQLKVIFNLPLNVVNSVFEVFAFKGYGIYNRVIDNTSYLGKD